MSTTANEDRTRAFDRSSPVHAYWLARCDGFIVESPGREGIVEEIGLIGERAAFLVVRYGRRRVEQVPVEAVAYVVPADEVLVLHGAAAHEPSPSRLVPIAHGARDRAGSLARSGASASGTAVTKVGRTTGAAAAVAWSAAGRSASSVRGATERGAPVVRRNLAAAAVATRGWLRRAGVAIGNDARRLRRDLGRSWAWLAPRVVSSTRRSAAWIRATSLAIAAAVEGAVRTHGPPAKRAVGRTVLGAVAGARTRVDGHRRNARGEEPTLVREQPPTELLEPDGDEPTAEDAGKTRPR
jgi:hypothetical protein